MILRRSCQVHRSSLGLRLRRLLDQSHLHRQSQIRLTGVVSVISLLREVQYHTFNMSSSCLTSS